MCICCILHGAIVALSCSHSWERTLLLCVLLWVSSLLPFHPHPLLLPFLPFLTCSDRAKKGPVSNAQRAAAKRRLDRARVALLKASEAIEEFERTQRGHDEGGSEDSEEPEEPAEVRRGEACMCKMCACVHSVRVCLGLRAEKKGWKAWGNDEAQSEEPELEGGPAEVCVGGGG
jgi:hypothetical protein